MTPNGALGKPKPEKLVSRNFVIIVAALGLLFIADITVSSVLSTYIHSLGNGAAVTGIIGLGWTVSAIVVRPLAGGFCDMKGLKRVALFGGLLFAATTFLVNLFPNAYIVLVLRVLQACGHAMLITAAYTAASLSVPSARSGEGAFYFNGIPQAVSQFVGGNLGVSLIIGGTDYFWVFTISALLSLGATAGILLQKRNQTSQQRQAELSGKKEEEIAGKGILKFIEPSAIPPTLIYFFGAIGLHGLQSFITLYAKLEEIGGVGNFFTANGVVQLICCFFAGRIVDRFGNLFVLVPAFCFGIAAYAYLLGGGTVFLVTGILYGFGAGLLKAPVIAMGMRRAPKGRMGTAQGTMNIAFGGAWGLASFVWGFVIDAQGFAGFFWGCIILLACTLVFTIFAVRKMRL